MGNQKTSVEEWVFENNAPEVIPYLQVNRFCGEQGSWVLLEGHLEQKDDQINREIFVFLRGLIVKSEECGEIVEILAQETIDEWALQACPEDWCTYAGEIPWCDTYPKNSWEELSFKNESVSGPFPDNVMDLIGIEDVETRLREQDLEIRAKTIEMEQPESQRFKILYPVRENYWADSLSAIVLGRNVATPSRQIADTLNLCGQPQSFDLFEKDGRRASITSRYGEKWGERQKFTYLRKDLLERYLAEINGKLIWVIRGERRIVPSNEGVLDEPLPRQSFKKVKVYPHSHSASRTQK